MGDWDHMGRAFSGVVDGLWRSVLRALLVGAIIGIPCGYLAARMLARSGAPAPGEYMLDHYEGTRMSPNHDASIFEFKPFDPESFDGGDYTVEIDEYGRWHLIPAV